MRFSNSVISISNCSPVAGMLSFAALFAAQIRQRILRRRPDADAQQQRRLADGFAALQADVVVGVVEEVDVEDRRARRRCSGSCTSSANG